jgi:carboxypeptidase C (cathepsin A)
MKFLLTISLCLSTALLLGVDTHKETPIEEKNVVVTEHHVTIRGKDIPYRAEAGMLPLKEDQGDVKGKIFYVSYERSDIENASDRPIAFCFNGGPGAASVWLHLGLLGPMRIELNDDAYNPPPYRYVPNAYSLLDDVDLVFIDPISTGYSRSSPGQDPKTFHGVDGDVKWLSEWVRLYTTQKGRWSSPKFLIGESYGTLRAVEMADSLHDNSNYYINGIILISSVLDFQTLDKLDKGNDLPFILALPTNAAVAWYHKRLSPQLQALPLEEIMNFAQAFATEEYSVALLAGDALTRENKQKIADKLSFYMGIPADYIFRSNLRVPQTRFSKELLRSESKVVGRFDGRLTGYSPDTLTEYSNYDPSLNIIIGPFAAVAHSYFDENLKWKHDGEYRVLTSMVQPWDYSRYSNKYLNVTPSLRDLLIGNPDLHVFIASGYYDLATPIYGSVYSINHLNLNEKSQNRIHMKGYGGGHMMYLSVPLLEKLSNDLHHFISNTLSK